MVAHYTVAKKRRNYDYYSPGGRMGCGVAVAVEDDTAVVTDGALDQSNGSAGKVLSALQLVGVALQLLGDSGVQDGVAVAQVLGRAGHTELKLVAGEGERGGAVAVGVVLHQLGQGIGAQVEHAARGMDGSLAIDDLLDDLGKLVAQEDGHNRWRSLVGAQTMRIGCTHDRCLEQTVVLVYTHQSLCDEDYETEVILRCLARTMKQNACICSETPVVVLTGTIDACEWLLMEKYAETVMASYLLHQAHQEHIVVNGKVGLLEDRCQLKLVWCYLVVTGLARNTEFKSLDFQILHESLNTLWDGAEVVVVHLLVLGRIMTHQGATCQHQVRTCCIQAFIYQEVLLLPTEIGNNFLDIRVEVVANLCCCYVYSVQ